MPLTMSMSVAQLLKKETFVAHSRAEKILAPKLTSIRNYDDYASILKTFYGFLHPLEKALTKYIGPDILIDIEERRNSFFILKDLQAIKYATEFLPICKSLPKINSSLEALGTMYVLEGSTLGGRMISKMLMKNTLVAFDNSNLNFFTGYKDNTAQKWTLFLSVLDQHENDADVIVEAANETFTCLTNWMEKSL